MMVAGTASWPQHPISVVFALPTSSRDAHLKPTSGTECALPHVNSQVSVLFEDEKTGETLEDLVGV